MSHTIVGRTSDSSGSRASGTNHTVLTIRRCGLEACDSPPSILALLPRLHAVSQGGKAGGVSVHSRHRAILVVLQVLSPPGGALVVSLKSTRAEGSLGPGSSIGHCVPNTRPSSLLGPKAVLSRTFCIEQP